ncbi:alpha/beta fold hydrolase [Roseomonas sp. GC11]|uniref:alpha/beta fold hydrolase n=1 Tax=Roseomonas sp. GC11 TaxID=2950546 RepID=UPI002108AD1E|nr:alpha/beta fold hydrolase [Roseomonas sp. GC11]MCQ4162223.1 alpha/beta fold hydrolase [Roseomonas sp. GC11]
MPVTVYYATSRASTGDSDPARAYADTLRPPGELAWGTALVGDARLGRLETGPIQRLDMAQQPGIPLDHAEALLAEGGDLLIFLHGFANSFPDAITRAAFNAQWLASARAGGRTLSVLAFCWPSQGEVVDPGDVVLGALAAPLTLVLACSGKTISPLCNAYQDDRAMAKGSGAALHSFLDRIRPLLAEMRAAGRRVVLLAHSMGTLVLAKGIEAMQATALPQEKLFDEILLAASDADWSEGVGAAPSWLLALPRIGQRVSVYHSSADQILRLSATITGRQRIGRSGPFGLPDAALYPAASWRFVDCHALTDMQPHHSLDSCHQYYRRLPVVRDDIAAILDGGAGGGVLALEDPPGTPSWPEPVPNISNGG